MRNVASQERPELFPMRQLVVVSFSECDGSPFVCGIAQCAEHFAVTTLYRFEALLEFFVIAIRQQQGFYVVCLLLSANRLGSELAYKGNRRQQSNDHSDKRGQLDKSGTHGTKEYLANAQGPVDAPAQRCLHGLEVE